MNKHLLIFIFFFIGILSSLAQKEKPAETSKDTLTILPSEKKLTWAQRDSVRLQRRYAKDSILKSKKAAKKEIRIAKREERRIKNIRPYNALAPSKAAFYSAIIPGLGQAYTGKYWKIPIVYGALGTSIGIALWNRDRLEFTRDIYRDRLRGIRTDRFFDQENNRALISDQGLVDAQQTFRKQQELSILISIGIYVLNIVDANVTAHLQQYNLNENLTLSPKIDINTDYIIPDVNYGLALKYNF